MMWWWGGDWSLGHWLGIGFMSVFWIAVIVGVIFLIRRASSRPEAYGPPPGVQPPAPGSPSAASRESLRILEERYAKGEIDREEFLQRKTDLTS